MTNRTMVLCVLLALASAAFARCNWREEARERLIRIEQKLEELPTACKEMKASLLYRWSEKDQSWWRLGVQEYETVQLWNGSKVPEVYPTSEPKLAPRGE